MSYRSILVRREGGVGIVTLNRPEALNALNLEMTTELGDALAAFERDGGIDAIVLTGSDRAFAAGADIKEIADKSFAEVFDEEFITATWENVARCRKPTLAAVSGHAVGGGFELALMCDIIIAAECARFSLPEARIGIIPGAGGTQRLTRAGGKALAMDMILTGRMIDAAEAERAGLVSRVVAPDALLDEACAAAAKIAGQSPLAVMMNKEMVNVALETTLAEGVRFERRLFHSLFAFEDQKEGMAAFVDKRKPRFTGR